MDLSREDASEEGRKEGRKEGGKEGRNSLRFKNTIEMSVLLP